MGRSLVVDDWIGLLALFIHRSALSARMAFVLQQIQTPIQCKNMLFKQPLRLIDLFARFLMNIVITQLAANPAHPESCQELQVVERQLRGTVKPRHFQISTAYCYIYIYIYILYSCYCQIFYFVSESSETQDYERSNQGLHFDVSQSCHNID